MKTNQIYSTLMLLLMFTATLAQEKIENDFFQIDQSVGLSDQQKHELSKAFQEAEQLEADNSSEVSKFKMNRLKSILTDYQFVVHLKKHAEFDAKRMTEEKIGQIAKMKNISLKDAKRYESTIQDYYEKIAMAQKRYAYDPEKLQKNYELLWNVAPPIVKELDMKVKEKEDDNQRSRDVGVAHYKNQYQW